MTLVSPPFCLSVSLKGESESTSSQAAGPPHDADISTRQMRDNAVRARWAELGGAQRVMDRRKQVREMERCWRRGQVGGEETAAEKHIAV